MSVTEQERQQQIYALRREKETLETRLARAKEKLESGALDGRGELFNRQEVANCEKSIRRVEEQLQVYKRPRKRS